MQMCFTEAIACCCIMQPGIKQYMLFVAFLKCKPEVTAELRDAAKNVNTMILAGKNTASPPSSHSLLSSCNFAKSFSYFSVKPKVTHLCDFHFDLRWLWVPASQDLTWPHQWQTQGSSGKSRGGNCTEVHRVEPITSYPTELGLKKRKRKQQNPQPTISRPLHEPRGTTLQMLRHTLNTNTFRFFL